MKLKLIDAAWIADRSLDVYAERYASMVGEIPPSKMYHRSNCTKAAVLSIFEEVYARAAGWYRDNGFDILVVAVPCFPIMRSASPVALMTRFICGKPAILKDYGISSNQFLEFFEKFVQLKSEEPFVRGDDGVFWVKERTTLLSEWRNAFVDHFGSMIVDFEKDAPFARNPGFISTMESGKIEYLPQNPLAKCKIEATVAKIVPVND